MVVEQETSPIIVYGAPRSGTTYLNRILNEHPEIFITHETRLFVWVHQSLNVLTQRDQVVLNYRERFVEHLRSVYPKLIRDFYRTLRPQARYWGDKNPLYASQPNRGCLDTIAVLFPETRFIHIIRDGRDVVSSLLRRGWVDFDTAHQIWSSHVDIGCAFGRSQPSSQYFELRYEDLIRDDVGVARKLFDFLRIEIHPNVVKFCQAQQAERTPLSKPTRDLSRGVEISDWESLLTSDQQVRSLELLGKHLVRYGYETESSLEGIRAALAREQPSQSALEQEQLLQQLTHRVREAVGTALPSDVTVIVISKGDDELLKLDGRRAWHFPQTEDGVYAGYYPADGAEAIAHLETLRAKGGDFLVFPSTALWWLEYYGEFRQHLERHYRAVVRQEDTCVIFALREPAPRRGQKSEQTAHPFSLADRRLLFVAPTYQEKDGEIVDYHMYRLEDTGLLVRGPEPRNLQEGEYFVCIGAAQTFGRFCEKPYPTLLQERLAVQMLNFGFAGAGPRYFLKNRTLLTYINRAKFAIIQVMSGRSESNSLFGSSGREILTRRSDGAKISAVTAYEELLMKYPEECIKSIIAETRYNWVTNLRRLLEEIKVPIILFWFSKREPDYKERYTDVLSLFREFPQLINSDMISEVKKYGDEYIECISGRGSPQLLISRFTGKPTTFLGRDGKPRTHNSYYPSPEMHIDAANILEQVCRKI